MNKSFCRNTKKHGKELVELPEGQYFCDEACKNQYWEKAVIKDHNIQRCIDRAKELAGLKREHMNSAFPIQGTGWRHD